MVVGAWTAVGCLVTSFVPTKSSGVGPLLLGILFGVALVVIGMHRWQSKDAYEALVKQTRAIDQRRWRQSIKAQAELAEEKLWVDVASALAVSIGVPMRLQTDFALELQKHTSKRRDEWGVDWWAAQPEYPPAPRAVAYRLGHEQYESFCAEWLRSLGWTSARGTRYTRDGGVDITTNEHSVQCKHYDGGYVGAREVREIFGVATATGKLAVVITSGRFTTDAREFANRAGVALIVLDERTALARPENEPGRKLLAGPA
ncbi:restriction endonuclease [Microbacterium sp. NPDC058345]|uniref:restriction endonuclease n=1 Tax=Microbacterium sp. NPDC058345 TaxID=3346455 RepID=UPI00365A9ACA